MGLEGDWMAGRLGKFMFMYYTVKVWDCHGWFGIVMVGLGLSGIN